MKLTVSEVVLIVIVWLALATLALLSVALTLTVKVPWLLYVVVKLAPVPVAGDPPTALQENVYGEVPPDADAVNVTAVPTFPLVGPLMVVVSVSAAIVIDAVAFATTALASVALTETV